MSSGSERILFLVLGAVLFLFVGVLLFLGPLGWVVAVVLLVLVAFLARSSGLLGGTGPSARSKVSCPACGARNSESRDVCHHCDEALSDA